MKSVLITGGMGFVGAHTALKFIEEGYDVVLYDLRNVRIELLKDMQDKYKTVIGDIRDWRKMLDTVRKYNVDGIVHCALPFSEHMTSENFEGCYNMLEICRLEKIRFVFVSSNAAYGSRPDSNPLLETDFVPVLSGKSWLSEYGVMKAICETLTEMYHNVHGVDTVSCRISWVYGPRAVVPSVSSGPNYTEWLLNNALGGFPSRLDHGGDFTINYSYVKDIADGLFRALTVRPLKHRRYNLSHGKTTSARELVEIVKRIIPGAVIEIGPGEMEKGTWRGFDASHSEGQYADYAGP